MPAASGGASAADEVALSRSAVKGRPALIAAVLTLNPDCTSKGYASIDVLTAPKAGTLQVKRELVRPDFPETGARAACNKVQVPGTVIYYTGTTRGAVDTIVLKTHEADGTSQRVTIRVAVK